MPLVSPGRRIACRVSVSPDYAGKARYALEALLVPLGLEPVYDEGEPQIVYGDGDLAGSESEGVLRLSAAPGAAAFFRGRRPFVPRAAVRLNVGGVPMPVPFTDERGAPDWVASAFLYLSGWHEAHADARDDHGRVPFEATLPGILGAADQPVVDAYRSALVAQLELAGINARPRQWEGRAWAFCPTHDIDYIRKWRPGIIYREAAEYLVMNRRHEPLPQRTGRFARVLAQMAAGDPYRSAFDRMIEEVAKRGGTATYFVKGGAGDPHDVAYALDGRFMRGRLRELKRRAFEIGLHPSYRTLDEADRLEAERDAVAAVAAAPVQSVRQHYLRFDPARTPHLHARLGFRIDSTIGFADRPGFRRGTCLPFRLYDLERDEPLDVWEMPLIIMESALFNRQNLAPDEAAGVTEACLEACRRHGGACVVLWHNTLWDEIDCPGWGDHMTQTLDAAVREGARIAALDTALMGWR